MYTDIIWLSPSGSLIKYGDGGQSDNGHHYSADYGPDIVRLNIVNVTMMDDGRWNCTVPAMDREQHCDTVLLEIQLTVVCKCI